MKNNSLSEIFQFGWALGIGLVTGAIVGAAVVYCLAVALSKMIGG